jgi:hypothetical protein
MTARGPVSRRGSMSKPLHSSEGFDVPKVKSRTTARQAGRKQRTTRSRRKPHQDQLASASLTTGAPDGAPANFGLVHVLKAEPLVTESPAIGERTVHHLEAGSNRLKPAQPQHPTPQQDAADPVLARIYPEGNAAPTPASNVLPLPRTEKMSPGSRQRGGLEMP